MRSASLADMKFFGSAKDRLDAIGLLLVGLANGLDGTKEPWRSSGLALCEQLASEVTLIQEIVDDYTKTEISVRVPTRAQG